MDSIIKTFNAALTAAAVGTFAASAQAGATEYGPALAMGNGQVRAFLEQTGSGAPKRLGIEFDDASLTGLPTAVSDGTWNVVDSEGNVAWFCCGHEHVLELPPSAVVTPFKHAVVNWNPHGHIPPGVYDLPHFDFHFYTITNEERQTIAAPSAEEMCDVGGGQVAPLSCADLATATQPLAASQLPPDYFSPGAVEPGMGNHLLDMLAPELAGETFTQTWIYGTWKGKISFFEPMITLAYFQELDGKRCYDLKLPEQFADPGYYPTRYCTQYVPAQGGSYTVELDQFAWYSGA